MEKNDKIIVTSFDAMICTAVMNVLHCQGFENVIDIKREQVDLCRQEEVEHFFETEKPDYVFLTAAIAGGLAENQEHLADFFYQNMIVEMNIIHSAWKHGCKRLLFIGSSSIYPKMVLQREQGVEGEDLEKTKEANALAKFSGLKYCEFLNKQYGTNYISVIPTNVYGPKDNYYIEKGRVIPAFISKFHEAKADKCPEVTCWGTGTALRDFLYVDDLAKACVFLMRNYSQGGTVNVGTGREVSIKNLADIIAQTVGYEGDIRWDETKPDGLPRVALDISRINELGWKASMDLEEGIRKTYADFLGDNP